jgi:hypothetical protein
MTRTERRAAARRGTAPTGVRRALDAALPRRSVDPLDPGDPDARLPHRLSRFVPPPLV